MGMNPMGGDAFSAPIDTQMNGQGQDMMDSQAPLTNEPDMMDSNEPEMGSQPFEDNDNEMSSDPEKKIESLAGKIASTIRKDLNGDGIDKHEDKKKEVLGMVASAVIDGMDDEQRQGIIDYLSDKLQGKGESDGDTDGGSQDDSLDNEQDDMPENSDMDMDFPEDGQEQNAMMESIINRTIKEVTNNILNQKRQKSSIVDNPEKNNYLRKPYRK